MSRKFRWFLLASCAFVVVMGGRESITLLARGPQVASSPPERNDPSKLAASKPAAKKLSPARKLAGDGEMAQGQARREAQDP